MPPIYPAPAPAGPAAPGPRPTGAAVADVKYGLHRAVPPCSCPGAATPHGCPALKIRDALLSGSFGDDTWTGRTIGRLGLERTIRREGRPEKEAEEPKH